MEVLYRHEHEREGNDSWLVDKVKIYEDNGDLYLQHRWDHKGWPGRDRASLEIELDAFDCNKSKQRIIDYFEGHCHLLDEKEFILEEMIVSLQKYVER